MGIDVDGGMIVGAMASKIKDIPNDTGEWCEDNDLDWFSPHYDSDPCDWVIGFCVADVDQSDFDNWCADVKQKMDDFYKLTGVEASLIGMQDVT